MTSDRTKHINSHDYLNSIIGIFTTGFSNYLKNSIRRSVVDFTTGFNNYSKTAMCRSVMI